MILITKEKARQLGLKARKFWFLKAKKQSSKICLKVVGSQEFKNAHSIGIYRPINSEVDVRQIIKAAFAKHKKVYMPKVIGGASKFVEITSIRDVIYKNGFYQPAGNNVIETNKLTVIYVPIVAFDKANFRVGYGHGYYDKLLEGYTGIAIGVAYSSQMVPMFKHEKFDVPMDKIITEK